MRGTSGRAAPELPRRQRIDGLAVRSWMLPRAKKTARAKRKIEGRVRVANGTAGQTQAFSQANPLGSVGFGELLVRTAECETVRKNRDGSNNGTPSLEGLPQMCPGAMDASRDAIRDANLPPRKIIQRTHFEGGGGSVRIKSLVLRHSE